MGILYGMVARGQVVLAEFSSAATTNANTIARQILEKARPDNGDSNASYSHDRYIFHVKRTDGLTVLCMADDFLERNFPSLINYVCLIGLRKFMSIHELIAFYHTCEFEVVSEFGSNFTALQIFCICSLPSIESASLIR